MNPGRPLALRVMERLLLSQYRDDVMVDLEESYDERRSVGPRWRSEVWLWRQVVNLETVSLVRLLWKRERGMGAMGGGARRGDFVGRWLRRQRHAARGLARRPGFTLTVVLTLALGIGANTAIFSVVDGILLEPLPYPDGHELVYVWGQTTDDNARLLSGPQSAEVVEREVFSRAAMIFGASLTSMTQDDLPIQVRTLTVSNGFFELFGVPPMLGRGFRPDDEFKLTNAQIRDPNQAWPVGAMVISHAFWQQNFGGDPDVLGQMATVSGRRKQVVGVMPPGFRTILPSALQETTPPDVWVMSAFDQPSFPRDTRFVRVVGRIREGATLNDAQQSLDALAAYQRQTFEEDARDEFSMRAEFLQDEAGATARGPLMVLLAAVGSVLLIACANVATLLLVRGAERSAEMRIRRSLGASRVDLTGISLSESLLAALLGGVAGVAIAPPLTRLLVQFAPAELPRSDAVGVDGSVLLFTAVVTLGVAFVAGALPALRSSSVAPAGTESSGRHTQSRRQHWTGGALVAIEVALAVILVTGTGLMLRSLGNVVSVDPGFEPAGVYAWEATLTTPTHPTWASRIEYFRGVQDAMRALPGVTAVGAMIPVPFDGADRGEVRLGMDENAVGIVADYRRTTPGALEALGVELLSGRLLDWSDLEDFDRLYAVVDQHFAERAWPDEGAVGQVISIVRREYGEGSRVWDEWKRIEVVGVVKPIHGRDLRTIDPPTVYVSYSQNMWGNPKFLARSGGALSLSTVRGTTGEVDRRPLVQGFNSLDAIAGARLAMLRFGLTLIGTFGTLGLMLAATGVYGLLSFTVGNREQELYIRAALGAGRTRLGAMVLRSGLTITAAGIVCGWVGAWGLTRFLASLLFNVTPTDPVTFVAVAGFLLGVAALACWIPSRRAGRADPAAALR